MVLGISFLTQDKQALRVGWEVEMQPIQPLVGALLGLYPASRLSSLICWQVPPPLGSRRLQDLNQKTTSAPLFSELLGLLVGGENDRIQIWIEVPRIVLDFGNQLILENQSTAQSTCSSKILP